MYAHSNPIEYDKTDKLKYLKVNFLIPNLYKKFITNPGNKISPKPKIEQTFYGICSNKGISNFTGKSIYNATVAITFFPNKFSE